jgi:hypothetical protein
MNGVFLESRISREEAIMAAMETTDFVNDMFKQATDNFNKTMRFGVQFQEQATNFWADTIGKSFDQMQVQADKVQKDAIPAAKKNLDQFHQMFDQQAKTSMEMLRKSFDANECVDVPAMADRTMKVWRDSFESMRANADTLAKTNVEMVESFCEMSKKACGVNGTGKTAQKPAGK